MSKPTAIALAALVAAAPLALAQEPAEGSFGEELYVTEVLLDVLVTDKEGNVILGLGPEDFVVEEAGAAVPVSTVTFYSNRAMLESPEALAAKGLAVDRVPQRRFFILFFQEQQRLSSDAPGLGLLQRQMAAAREAREWVERELLLDDWVAVVSYDAKLKVHQDFTRDKAAVVRAINGAVTGKDPGNVWPSRIPEEEAAEPTLLARLPQGNELRRATPKIYDALTLVAEAAGGLVGRKNLILFSTGFGNINSFGQYVPDGRYYPPMMQTLNDNNVAVYSVDLTPNGTFHVQAGGLNQLAAETGGRYYFNFTSFQTPLEQLAAENSGYYLLAYESRHPAGSSGYQQVQVAAKNPELKVRAREGYLYGR